MIKKTLTLPDKFTDDIFARIDKNINKHHKNHVNQTHKYILKQQKQDMRIKELISKFSLLLIIALHLTQAAQSSLSSEQSIYAQCCKAKEMLSRNIGSHRWLQMRKGWIQRTDKQLKCPLTCSGNWKSPTDVLACRYQMPKLFGKVTLMFPWDVKPSFDFLQQNLRECLKEQWVLQSNDYPKNHTTVKKLLFKGIASCNSATLNNMMQGYSMAYRWQEAGKPFNDMMDIISKMRGWSRLLSTERGDIMLFNDWAVYGDLTSYYQYRAIGEFDPDSDQPIQKLPPKDHFLLSNKMGRSVAFLTHQDSQTPMHTKIYGFNMLLDGALQFKGEETVDSDAKQYILNINYGDSKLKVDWFIYGDFMPKKDQQILEGNTTASRIINQIWQKRQGNERLQPFVKMMMYRFNHQTKFTQASGHLGQVEMDQRLPIPYWRYAYGYSNYQSSQKYWQFIILYFKQVTYGATQKKNGLLLDLMDVTFTQSDKDQNPIYPDSMRIVLYEGMKYERQALIENVREVFEEETGLYLVHNFNLPSNELFAMNIYYNYPNKTKPWHNLTIYFEQNEYDIKIVNRVANTSMINDPPVQTSRRKFQTYIQLDIYISDKQFPFSGKKTLEVSSNFAMQFSYGIWEQFQQLLDKYVKNNGTEFGFNDTFNQTSDNTTEEVNLTAAEENTTVYDNSTQLRENITEETEQPLTNTVKEDNQQSQVTNQTEEDDLTSQNTTQKQTIVYNQTQLNITKDKIRIEIFGSLENYQLIFTGASDLMATSKLRPNSSRAYAWKSRKDNDTEFKLHFDQPPQGSKSTYINETVQEVDFVNGFGKIRVKLNQDLTEENNPRYPIKESMSIIGTFIEVGSELVHTENDVACIFYQNKPIKEKMARPDWYHQIGPKLRMYSLLFPAMQDIVDLYNYQNMSMDAMKRAFHVEDPYDLRYMPANREFDMVEHRRIRRWLYQPYYRLDGCDSGCRFLQRKRDEVPLEFPDFFSRKQHLIDNIHKVWKIEHSLIPVYLSLMSSSPNKQISNKLDTITWDLMKNLFILSNLLNALGSSPPFGNPSYIPSFPSRFENVSNFKDQQLKKLVDFDIEEFNLQQIMKALILEIPVQTHKLVVSCEGIENPSLKKRVQFLSQIISKVNSQKEDPESELTILTDLYAHIIDEIWSLFDMSPDLFNGNPQLQISYMSLPGMYNIIDLNTALNQLRLIVKERQGISLFYPTDDFKKESHFLKLLEIYSGCQVQDIKLMHLENNETNFKISLQENAVEQVQSQKKQSGGYSKKTFMSIYEKILEQLDLVFNLTPQMYVENQKSKVYSQNLYQQNKLRKLEDAFATMRRMTLLSNKNKLE